MLLKFNLEDVKYLKMKYVHDNGEETIKLSLVEKLEDEFVASINDMEILEITYPQKVSLGFVCIDGLYSTLAEITLIEKLDNEVRLHIKNPKSLDYHQNREYYRVLYKQDCIYTVYEDYETHSYNAETFDISEKGVSILLEDNIMTKNECSLTIFSQELNIKSHLKFIRSEVFDDMYKLSFEFLDLSDKDRGIIKELCKNNQLKN